MPLYDYVCSKCGNWQEILSYSNKAPICCGEVMTRKYVSGNMTVKIKYPLWVDRIDDIQKAQQQRGERLRFVHPKEVLT